MAPSSLSTRQLANFLNPSCRIPPETLTYIFSHICQSSGRTKGTGFLTTELVGRGRVIVTLTHVCRYWRATLLSTPKFWTSVNLTWHPSVTAPLLERSGSMPITAAFITSNLTTSVPSTEVLLPHFPRIRKVHIDASLDQLMQFLSKLSGRSPILEAVELQCTFEIGPPGDEVDEVQAYWKEVFKLTPMLKDAPGLKFLRMLGLPFSDCLLQLHHLTHLELLSTSSVGSRDYLAIMSANPMLEVIILCGTGDRVEGLHDMEATAISLPHLRRMELCRIPVDRILRGFTFPPGVHLSCDCFFGYVIPDSSGLLNISTATKLQFAFSRRPRRVSRLISGYGPNGTFLLSDNSNQLNLYIPEISLRSLEELSISFAGTGAEGSPALSFVDAHGPLFEFIFASFSCLRVLILQQVDGCEIIFRLLRDPHIFPKLNTLVLAKAQSHTTYWSSLVEMARVRDQDTGSSDVRHVDISCRAEELPEPDQLAELRAHVFLVEINPWNYEVGKLDWLKDSRFRNLGRL